MSAVEVEGLALRIGARAVLRGASLRLEEGELAVLAGPSGGGKSALLRLLVGLGPRASDFAIRGGARVLGLDALRTPTPLLARNAGLLFQDVAHQVTQPSVEAELAFRPENLGLPPREVDERVASVARRFGLEALLERPTHALSGGELKRMALAAVLAAEPRVLLLDEPLGSLDAEWRAALLRDLEREARERAVLVAEHRLGELAALRAKTWRIDGGVLAPGRLPGPHARAARPRRPGARRGGEPLVAAEALRVARDGRALLDDVAFEAGEGLTLVLGPNGSGKTTLLRSLAGLEPSEGRLRVAGLDPRAEPRSRFARAVGYVPQHAEEMLFAASVREELAFGPRNLLGRADPERLEGLARALGLAGLLDRHPLTLSGGERQRLALACAMAHGPRVLLLDEPTVGLDAAGLARCIEAMERARRRCAVLLASHDPGLLALADQALVLDEGRVAYAGPVENMPPRLRGLAPTLEVRAR